MEGGEGILYADVDLESIIIPKINMDFGGHYNRFDVFEVRLHAGDTIIDLTASGPGGAPRPGAPLTPTVPQVSWLSRLSMATRTRAAVPAPELITRTL